MIQTGTQPNKFWTIHWRADKLLNTLRRTSTQTVPYYLIAAYLIRKNDCETMVRSYVDDCGQFLDIANRENVRILAGKTLIWFVRYKIIFEICYAFIVWKDCFLFSFCYWHFICKWYFKWYKMASIMRMSFIIHNIIDLYLIINNQWCSRNFHISPDSSLPSRPSNQFQVSTRLITGHKPPAIADNVAGRYAGSLFSAASKNEALDVVLKDLTHLNKVVAVEPLIREFLKNSAIKRNQQKEVIASFAPQQYHQVTNNFLNTLIESGRYSVD